MKITPQEIADWRQNPITCRVMGLFKKIREEEKEKLSEGFYTFPNVDETIQKTSVTIGLCQAFKEILEVDYESFLNVYEELQPKEEEEDE